MNEKQLVDHIAGTIDVIGAQTPAMAEMQRRQVEAVREFNHGSARQARLMIWLTIATFVLTAVMAWVAWREFLNSGVSVPVQALQQRWHGFYYPIADAARLSQTADQLAARPEFGELQTCIEWGRGRMKGQPQAAFECASGCRFDNAMKDVICKDTTRLIRQESSQ
jgi:hypothetical protein